MEIDQDYLSTGTGICPRLAHLMSIPCYVLWEVHGIHYWPVFTFILQFKYKLVKLSDKAANFFKSTNYLSSQQNNTAAQDTD